MQNGTRLAAVDLGSNSFRLEIGRLDHGQFSRTEYIKEPVRQGSGLDDQRNLTPEAMQRGLECLARFGERLAGFKKHQVRAVATQTLREARNRDEFLQKANEALGFPIDVISGREEARLIYLGVAKLLPQSSERRLVVDIGGRSTELILGSGFDARAMESYRVGSIAWSARYFSEGKFTSRIFKTAEIAAKAVLDDALNAYRSGTWDVAYGSAGTIGAVGDILAAAGWSDGSVNLAGLDWLREKLIDAQNVDRLRLAGLKDDRRAIIAGGLSILRASFDLLGISEMKSADGGLRHGVLADLIGDTDDTSDTRARSVRRLTNKFEADTVHGDRVGNVATQLYDQLSSDAHPASDPDHERNRRQLIWSAQLHEIGGQISHSDHHKHGAYILDNSDALGFAVAELHRLSLLVLGQRGKLRKLDADFEDTIFVQQLMSLRLAIILCHARRDPDTANLVLSQDDLTGNVFNLTCRPGWADAYPQTTHLLREEMLAWQKTSCQFSFSQRTSGD